MKQSDINLACNLNEKIEKMENSLESLTDEKVENDLRINLASYANNYNDRTSWISSGIKDSIRSLIIADLQSQVQFMKKRIENL